MIHLLMGFMLLGLLSEGLGLGSVEGHVVKMTVESINGNLIDEMGGFNDVNKGSLVRHFSLEEGKTLSVHGKETCWVGHQAEVPKVEAECLNQTAT